MNCREIAKTNATKSQEYLRSALDLPTELPFDQKRAALIAAAQVHATLAVAAAQLATADEIADAIREGHPI